MRLETVTVDGLDYRESLSAVNISGGVAGNVVPDECVVSVNYRFAPSRSAAEAEAFLREFFTGFDIVVTDAAEGARPGLDRPIAQDFIDTLGLSPAPKLGWTDVSRFECARGPGGEFRSREPAVCPQVRRACQSRRGGAGHPDPAQLPRRPVNTVNDRGESADYGAVPSGDGPAPSDRQPEYYSKGPLRLRGTRCRRRRRTSVCSKRGRVRSGCTKTRGG